MLGSFVKAVIKEDPIAIAFRMEGSYQKNVKAMEPNLRWKEVAEGKGKMPKNLFEGLVLKAETHKKTKKLKKKKKKKKKR